MSEASLQNPFSEPFEVTSFVTAFLQKARAEIKALRGEPFRSSSSPLITSPPSPHSSWRSGAPLTPGLCCFIHHIKITSVFSLPPSLPPLWLSQRSSAQALSEITAKVLRAINATEEAVWESWHGESQGCALPAGQLPGLADGKEVAEVYRELEENVRLPRAFGQRERGGNRKESPPPPKFCC